MAYAPNFVGVPSRSDGAHVTIINAAVIDREFELDFMTVPCRTGLDHFVAVVNAAIFGRHWIPQPFASSLGIQHPEVWGTFIFGPGYTGILYREQWYLENVTHPVVFSMDSGQLPPGLHLSATASTGQIQGIPTQAGTYSFTLLADAPDAQATKAFSIQITDITPPSPPSGPSGTSYVSGN